jgi:hypothetical protein
VRASAGKLIDDPPSASFDNSFKAGGGKNPLIGRMVIGLAIQQYASGSSLMGKPVLACPRRVLSTQYREWFASVCA